MQHAAPDRHACYRERFSFALLFPRSLLIGHIALIGGFGVVIVGLLRLLHMADLPRNRFAMYADIYPGQPASALTVYGFTCEKPLDESSVPCNLALETGDFSRVTAIYSGEIIQLLTFDLRDNTLSVGELIARLGPPVIRFNGSLSFDWRGNVGIARMGKAHKRFSLFGYVGQVTLTTRAWHRS